MATRSQIVALAALGAFLVFVGNASSVLASPWVDPALNKARRAGAPIRAIVYFGKPSILVREGLSREMMIDTLKDSLRRSVDMLSQTVRARGARRLADFQVIEFNWINNSALVTVSTRAFDILGALPDGMTALTKVYADRKIERDLPVRGERYGRWTPAPGAKHPYDFHEMNLDSTLMKYPALDGTGVVVGHIDTGVDGDHDAIKSKLAPYFDSMKAAQVSATDSDTHGTHTAGTVVGGDRSSMVMGIAPGATLLSSGPLGDFSDILRGMAYMADPLSYGVNHAPPRLVTNSWNCAGAPDMELFYSAIETWEKLGIVTVFSAGNAGPTGKSITPPHEHPLTLAVGATDSSGKIVSFSSRGPGIYQNQSTKKPDLTAPGADILSSVPGGKYEKMSGTSMAAPHAAGTIALMLQADPSLTPADVRSILLATTDARKADGSAGVAGTWNEVYGFGKINVFRAVEAAIAHHAKARGLSAFQLGFVQSR